MQYLDIRFPEFISIGSVGGPEFSTTISQLKGGVEVRNKNFIYPRYKYNILTGIKNIDDFNVIKSFFLICCGKNSSFRFKDFTDFTIMNQQLGICNGNNKVFQIYKNYFFNGIIFQRKITKIVKSSVVILNNNNQLKEFTDYNVDYVNGLITFVSVPVLNNIINITCEFDVCVRFDIDFLPIILDGLSLIKSDSLSLIETFG